VEICFNNASSISYKTISVPSCQQGLFPRLQRQNKIPFSKPGKCRLTNASIIIIVKMASGIKMKMKSKL
jgi:hypothetical protein